AVLARPIGARLRGPGWLREVLAVTLAAQLGVAPVLLPVFGSVPLVSLPANLVAVPLAAPLTVWGLASGVIGGLVRPFAPQAAAALCVPSTALVHALLAVADLAARGPIAIDGKAAIGVVALAAPPAAAQPSGFADPDYLAVAARHGASVVATHIRLQPRIPDPEPHYDDLLGEVTEFLLDRAARAELAGLARDQIALDAGLDLGKTAAQSTVL